VENYNGEDDDFDVTVSAFGSRGLVTADGDGGVTDPTPPTRTTADKWSVMKSSVAIESPLTSTQSQLGYVRGRRLVVSMDVTLGVSSDFIIPVRSAYLVATIAGTPGAYRLENGVVAGRWPAVEALKSLGRFKDQSNQYLCLQHGGLLYQTGKNLLCTSVDVAQSAKNDRSGAACAIGFDAVPASLGPVVPDAPPTPCDGLPAESCGD
jgi:hypothetical protein